MGRPPGPPMPGSASELWWQVKHNENKTAKSVISLGAGNNVGPFHSDRFILFYVMFDVDSFISAVRAGVRRYITVIIFLKVHFSRTQVCSHARARKMTWNLDVCNACSCSSLVAWNNGIYARFRNEVSDFHLPSRVQGELDPKCILVHFEAKNK